MENSNNLTFRFIEIIEKKLIQYTLHSKTTLLLVNKVYRFEKELSNYTLVWKTRNLPVLPVFKHTHSQQTDQGGTESTQHSSTTFRKHMTTEMSKMKTQKQNY